MRDLLGFLTLFLMLFVPASVIAVALVIYIEVYQDIPHMAAALIIAVPAAFLSGAILFYLLMEGWAVMIRWSAELFQALNAAVVRIFFLLCIASSVAVLSYWCLLNYRFIRWALF
ncbi:hypothetical protein IHQ71_04215 [Rhizobium sp. TH2]|uniref:hypothetical protein n=1 Tax=Rhizobium sp. TH2 TaxID=2775403 RepID=UPI0021572F92|nr:hypothetical protein [Rhizobium sp. TH2]UVC09826.1 hypothetical protein IHQ71_04215 [Rhizobium sp. TH2]